MRPVPRPLAYIPSYTGSDPDSRFGFHLPPHLDNEDALVPPLVAGSSNPPFDPSVTTRVSPISEVPIDPVLLAESQSMTSHHPPSVVYQPSSSQVCHIHTSGLLDSGSGDDSEGEGEDDFEADYSTEGGESSDELEPVSGETEAHVHNSFPVNAQD